ncbi:MAG: outer membrane protein assembly factor BamA [Candidatus Omnitrophica bacterium]|nr:outer membrane protein assembly factor BamA [Candidatus Omnitrophota bacterium]
MKNRIIPFLVLGLWVLIFFSISNQSEEVYGAEKTVAIIKTRGNKIISSATILSKIKTKPGDIFSQEQLNADLKRLFGLGFFTDIAIEVEDYEEERAAVTFVVVEKPLISQIVFSGNRNFRSEKLKRLMKSAENEMLSETKVTRDIGQIKTMYKKRGYQLVEVDYKIDINEEKNTAKITVTVEEKSRFRIKKIHFIGNKNIASKKLLRTIETRPDTLFTSGYFKEDTFQTDLEKLKALYAREGFLDIDIIHKIRYDRTGRWIDLIIEIEEGKKYIVGDIFIKGNVIFPEKEIRLKLNMLSGQAFSQLGLRQDKSHIQHFYYQRGYMLAQVDGTSALNSRTGKIDITYTVIEDELIYIDKIKVRGNTKTKDVVIRRELRAYPGEKFDGDRLRRSKERLYNLGYFEEVTLDTNPGTAPNKQDLIVTVKETKTGEFSFGGGFSSVERMIGFVSVTQKNFDLLNFPSFTGDGQKLRLVGEFGTIRENYELGWTEPWIFDFPLLFGFDAYQRTRSRREGLGYGYEEQRTGGDIRFGKEFTEYLSADLMYTMEDVKIEDVSSDASAALKAEEGKNQLNKLLLHLAQDKRNNIFNPTMGYLISNSIEGAGGVLGGDKDFTKYVLGASFYFTHFKNFVLELKGKLGIADAFDDTTEVPIYERFYAGGSNTVRGYRERRIGPKDATSNDPIGGEGLFIGNIEYTFPLYEKVIKGAIFCDIGNVWEQWEDVGTDGLKTSAGVGVRVKTPIGPVRLDFGVPFSEISGEEKKGRFHFTLSQGF